jgi:phosphoglycolate phosphatase-like HAD superfamily hydrolase
VNERPTVLLFDIDGTLILTGGAGRRAMEHAFAETCGSADRGHPPLAPLAPLHFSFAGMTDRAIAREGLRAARREATREAIDALLDAYLARLEHEVERADGYRVMPGVEATLAAVRGLAHVAVGLGTGNVKRGAYTKLARGALGDAFAFGGFGCDAEDRAELLRVGARRGADAIGAPVESCRVVVIGDTPKDVAAALAIGAECVAVGTGGFDPRELAALGAHHAFATLDDPGAKGALLTR